MGQMAQTIMYVQIAFSVGRASTLREATEDASSRAGEPVGPVPFAHERTTLSPAGEREGVRGHTTAICTRASGSHQTAYFAGTVILHSPSTTTWPFDNLRRHLPPTHGRRFA